MYYSAKLILGVGTPLSTFKAQGVLALDEEENISFERSKKLLVSSQVFVHFAHESIHSHVVGGVLNIALLLHPG